MPDLKYGSIYTEADVHKIVEAVLENGDVQGPEGTKNVIDAIRDDLTFRRDEPVFLLRGQDAAAYGTIDEYRFAISRGATDSNGRGYGPAGEGVQQQVQQAVTAFEEYASANPEVMKVAD